MKHIILLSTIMFLSKESYAIDYKSFVTKTLTPTQTLYYIEGANYGQIVREMIDSGVPINSEYIIQGFTTGIEGKGALTNSQIIEVMYTYSINEQKQIVINEKNRFDDFDKTPYIKKNIHQQINVPEITTIEQRFSYAFGAFYSTLLSDKPVEIEVIYDLTRRKIRPIEQLSVDEILTLRAKGYLDVVNQQSQFSVIERRDIINRVINDRQTHRLNQLKKDLIKNEKIGKQYQTQFAKQKQVKQTNSGLLYQINTEGKGNKPKKDDTVVINLTIKQLDGQEIYSTNTKNKPITIDLYDAIKGFSEGIPLLKIGSKATYVMPPHLTYGNNLHLLLNYLDPRINLEAGMTLIFIVELLDIE